MKADPNFSAASSCSELEKLVGRRTNPGVSLAEQQERFPFLKDAPVEHAYAAGVKVRAGTGFVVCFVGRITAEVASRAADTRNAREASANTLCEPLSPTILLEA